MTFFLAAIVAFLFILIFGALDAPFRPIMAKRGWSDESYFSCLMSVEDTSDMEEDISGRV